MSTLKRSILAAVAVTALFAAAACGSSATDETSEPSGSQSVSETSDADAGATDGEEETSENSDDSADADSDTVQTVAILNLANVPSLTQIVDGAVDYLHSHGYDDANLVIDSQNANADISIAQTIATKFVADKPDAIITISTPALQAAVNATKLEPSIPVLFGAVSDPVSAGAVDSLDGPTGTNVTGVYNINPIPQVLDVAEQVIPGIERIGIIYNAGEDNSVADSDFVKEEAGARGIDVVEATVTNTNDVQAAAQSIIGEVDAILMLQDSTVATGSAAIYKLARDAQLPVLSIDADLVKDGAVIGLGRNATETGAQLGAMVVQVLQGTDVGTIPLEPVSPAHIVVNTNAAEATGMTIPAEILDQAQIVDGN